MTSRSSGAVLRRGALAAVLLAVVSVGCGSGGSDTPADGTTGAGPTTTAPTASVDASTVVVEISTFGGMCGNGLECGTRVRIRRDGRWERRANPPDDLPAEGRVPEDGVAELVRQLELADESLRELSADPPTCDAAGEEVTTRVTFHLESGPVAVPECALAGNANAAIRSALADVRRQLG